MIRSLEQTMHQAANVQFERIVHEFARWRAVPEQQRSQAPAWWWGPAFEVRGVAQPMPADWCAGLELPDGTSFADGADILLASLAGQTSLPWSADFPKAKYPDTA
jgi:hypothetical protein